MKCGPGATDPVGGAGHSNWQVVRLHVMPACGGLPPQSAGHSHWQDDGLHCLPVAQPPQSASQVKLQTAGFVLQNLPTGSSLPPQPGHSHSQVWWLQVENALGLGEAVGATSLVALGLVS